MGMHYWKHTTKGKTCNKPARTIGVSRPKDMFQEEMIEYQEVRDQAEQLVKRYIDHYNKVGDDLKIHAVEEHFQVAIPTAKGYKSMTDLQGVLTWWWKMAQESCGW